MTDQDREDEEFTEEFAWVRRAYMETPAAAPRAVEAARLVARAIVVSSQEDVADIGPVRIPTSVERHGVMRHPVWRRWGGAGVVLAAGACIVVVWMTGYERGGVQGHGAMVEPSSHAFQSPSSPMSSALPAGSGVASSVAPDVRRTPANQEPARPEVSRATAPARGVPRVATSAMRTSSPTPGTLAPASTAPMDSVLSRGVAVPAPAIAEGHPSNGDAAWSARVVEGLDPESAVQVRHVLDSAAAQGLPLDILTARVREGVHRGVPGPRIAVVARNLAVALGDARTTLGQSASPVEVQAGAEALAAGAPRAALRQIRLARPHESIAEPLVALTDLTAHGVAPLQASAALSALAARDRSDASVQALRVQVVNDILEGRPPNTALADRVSQTTLNPPSGQQPPLKRGQDSLSRPPHTP